RLRLGPRSVHRRGRRRARRRHPQGGGVMKILLVYPNANRELIGWGDLGAVAEPLALEYVAAATRADGHEVELLDLRLHPGMLEITLWGFRPDVVGVTGYSMHVLRN